MNAAGRIVPARHLRCVSTRGWAYLESLIALLIVGLVLPPALSLVALAVRFVAGERAESEARDNGREALAILQRLILNAGCNPHRVGMRPIYLPGPSSIGIESDIGGGPHGQPDGVLDDPFEQVLIEWDAATRQITIASGSGTRQPLARNIAALSFNGLDRHGALTMIENDVVYISLEIRPAAESGHFGRRLALPTIWRARVPILARLQGDR